MISYNEILKVIEAFTDGHKFKPRFYAEFVEQLPNLATEDIDFPVIFCNPTNGSTLENVEVTEVEIYCLDRLRKDRKNTNDVVSDTKQILSQDLTRWLEEGQQDVEIERAYPCQPYNNYLLDYTAGWSMRVVFHNERISICEVPVDPIEPSDSCQEATVKNSDNSYTQSVESGGTLILPNASASVNGNTEGQIPSVQDFNVNIVDDSGIVTPDDVAISGTNLNITLSSAAQASGGGRLLKTGVTQSVTTNDDGFLQEGRNNSWFILDTSRDTNPFGNHQRFTGTSGGYYDQGLSSYFSVDGVATTRTLAFPDTIIIDWSQWDQVNAEVVGYRPVNIGLLSLINGISAITSLSVGIYTSGWRMWNEYESEAVRYRPMSNSMYNWSPFEVSSLSSFTCTPIDQTAPLPANMILATSTGIGKSAFNSASTRFTYGSVRTFTVTGTALT